MNGMGAAILRIKCLEKYVTTTKLDAAFCMTAIMMGWPVTSVTHCFRRFFHDPRERNRHAKPRPFSTTL